MTMVYKIEDIGYDTAKNALVDQGFGLFERKGADGNVSYAEVYTEADRNNSGVAIGGWKIGQIVRQVNAVFGIYTLEITEHNLFGRDGAGRERLVKVLSQIVNRDSLR